MKTLSLIIGFIILFLYFLIVPTVIGIGGCRLLYKKKRIPTTLTYIWGNVILLALYELLYIPVTFLSLPFHVLCIIFGICILLMMLATFLICKNELRVRFKASRRHIKHLPPLAYVLFVLVFIQICFYVFGANLSGSAGDDDGYVVMSLNTITDNRIMVQDEAYGTAQDPASRIKYSLSAWPHYISFLGKITGIHTTILSHTFLPIILVIMAYMVYSLLGHLLFKRNKKKTYWFLIWLYIILSFGAYSWYTVTFRLNITVWQGKGVLAAILLPFTLYFTLTTKHWKFRELIQLSLLVCSSASLTPLGLGFTLLITGSGFITQIKKKKLHDIIFLIPVLFVCFILICLFIQKWSGEFPLFSVDYYKNSFPLAADNLLLAYRNYWNGSWIQYVFYGSIIFLFLDRKKNPVSKQLLRYILMIAVIIFNPLFYTATYIIFPQWTLYIRMFYNLFPEIIMSYAITSAVALLGSEILRWIGTIGMLLYVTITGTSFQSVAQFQLAKNLYKLPSEAIEICQFLKEDCPDTPIVFTPTDMNVFLRQYDNDITLFWSRWDFHNRLPQLPDASQEYYNSMIEYNLYLILDLHANELDAVKAMGAQPAAIIGNYVVLKPAP